MKLTQTEINLERPLYSIADQVGMTNQVHDQPIDSFVTADQNPTLPPLLRENEFTQPGDFFLGEEWTTKKKSDCTLHFLRTEEGQIHCRIVFPNVDLTREQFAAAAMDVDGQGDAVKMLNASGIDDVGSDSIAFNQALQIKDPMGFISIGTLSDRVTMTLDDSHETLSSIKLTRITDGGSALGSVASGECVYNHESKELEISFVIDLGDTDPVFMGMKPVDLPQGPVRDVLNINALSYARDLKQFVESYSSKKGT